MKRKRFVTWLIDWCRNLDVCEDVKNNVKEVCNMSVCNAFENKSVDWDAWRNALDAKKLTKNVASNCTSLKRRESLDVTNIVECLSFSSFKRCLNVATNFLKTIENVKKDVEEASNVDVCHVLTINIDDWNALKDALDAKELIEDVSELTNLLACFKRTCSWSLLFELKIFSQCLQVTWEQLFFCACYNSLDMNENFVKHWEQLWYCNKEVKIIELRLVSMKKVVKDEKILIKATLKLINELISSCFLNQIYVESRKHLTKATSTLCFLYWATSRRCRKLTLILKRWNSKRFNCIIKSKKFILLTQIFDFDVSIVASFVVNDLILTTINFFCAFFAIVTFITFFDWVTNSRQSFIDVELNEIDWAQFDFEKFELYWKFWVDDLKTSNWVENFEAKFSSMSSKDEIACKKFVFELFEIDVDVFSFDVCTNATKNVIDVEVSTIDWIIASKHDSIDVELSEMLKTWSLLNVWTIEQFENWRLWALNEFLLNFQSTNVKSHFEHVMRFSMFIL